VAQKRMFDRAIIDTDNFMDMPISSKALYFLLGMDADDEGFVSPRKIIRIHGGTDDDVKLLSAKGFVIPFESGVVVITDWNSNNYLQKNRIKPTIHKKERNKLKLTDDNKYELNNGLTSIEESRVEQSSIEQSSIGESNKKINTQSINKEFFNKDEKQEEMINILVEKGFDRIITEREIIKFVSYWTEPNKSGSKVRWELQKTFEITRRLATWFNNIKDFKKSGGICKI